MTENDLETLLNDPETPTHSYWCYRCDDFTPHKPMENGNTYCLTCHHERESALVRHMPADKRPLLESTRYVVTGYYNDRSYYLASGGTWSRFKFEAKQFKEKRAAHEARETTPRPANDFYPNLLTIDNRDKDFTINNDDETSEFLTAIEDFDEWEPLCPEETTDPITTPRRWGERQIPGLAELHDAVAEMSNPDGTFRSESGSRKDK